MGFLYLENKRTNGDLKGLTPEFLHRHGCAVCPLDAACDLIHPKMPATGSDRPVVYVLGEAAGKQEDEQGKQFVGASGKILRRHIPRDWLDSLRWNNTINCRPEGNRDPSPVELESCRPRVVEDIEQSQPLAIFGFGAVPLNWALQESGITVWRGRRVPVRIGMHECWYYPMLHPSYLLHKRKKFDSRNNSEYESEEEFVFALDIKRALAEIESLPAPTIHTVEQAKADIELVDDVGRVIDLLQETVHEPSAGIDLETTCLRPYSDHAKILSVALSSQNNTFAFGLDHPQCSWSKSERSRLDNALEDFLYAAKCKKIAHHLPFEMEWLAYFYGKGCLYAGPWECSLSQAYILDNRRGGLSLDFLCLQYFGFNIKAISNLDRATLIKSPLRQVLQYNGIDARYHRLLYLAQQKRLKEKGMLDVYAHQLRRIPALVLTQMQGVPIDPVEVERLRKKYQGRADDIGKIIAQEDVVQDFEKEKGKPFNPSSHQDVNYLVQEILQVETTSSDKEQLAQVKHPIAKHIVKWREVNKNLSTYITPVMPDSPHLYSDGMLHPVISTTTTRSGRTSSESPNIQNFPKRDDESKEVRAQVKPLGLNQRVVSFDWAGIQARNVAMESLDKGLVDIYWTGYDIHQAWLEKIVKYWPKWIPASKAKDKAELKKFRHLAKNKFVFPTFFGAQPFSIAQSLDIPENKIQMVQEEFWDQFPDIKKWHLDLAEFYRKNGYVTGLSGYRREAPVSGNELVNTPIQADEAYIVTDAMARLSAMEDDRYQPILMVHDDLTFIWDKNEIDRNAEVVIKTLITVPFEWARVVPIEVEMLIGENWLEMKDAGKYSSDKWDGHVAQKT